MAKVLFCRKSDWRQHKEKYRQPAIADSQPDAASPGMFRSFFLYLRPRPSTLVPRASGRSPTLHA